MQQRKDLMQMQPMMASYYSNNVTTDHIQQYLDENKSLILRIVESQNSGKLSECAENQARLQRNLMYLAAIADSQPPTLHSQHFPPGPSGGIMSPGGQHYMQQHQEAESMAPQAMMAARSSMIYSQHPYAALQQSQIMQGQVGIGLGSNSGLTVVQGDPRISAAASGSALLSDFGCVTAGEGMLGIGIRGAGKQDVGTAGSADGRGHGGGGIESLYWKSSDDGN